MSGKLVKLLVLILVIFSSGCSAEVINKTESVKPAVTAKSDPEPIMDIYVSIREQFLESNHSNSLKTLKGAASKGRKVQGKCIKCHSFDLVAVENVEGVTLADVKTGITCGSCHKVNEEGYYVLLKDDSNELCGSCHYAEDVKPGEVLDHAQLNMFKGISAIGIENIPDKRLVEGVKCADCHMPNQNHNFQSLTPKKAREIYKTTSCTLCHLVDNMEEFSKLVEDTQIRVETDSKELFAEAEAVLKEIKAGTSSYSPEEQEKIKAVYTNLSFVIKDGSRGMHNIEYTERILQNAKEVLKNQS